MKLIVAEKMSVAKSIASALGVTSRADPDDYEFEDEEYENEDVPEQGEQEDQN